MQEIFVCVGAGVSCWMLHRRESMYITAAAAATAAAATSVEND